MSTRAVKALSPREQVIVFNRVSGDSIVSQSTLSLGGSVQDACEGIPSDWAAHGKVIRAVAAPSPAVHPAPTATPSVPAATSASVSSNKTQIQVSSTPDAAVVKIDGSFVGNTPSTIGVSAGQHQISVRKSGFKPWERKIAISSGQINPNTVLEPEQK